LGQVTGLTELKIIKNSFTTLVPKTTGGINLQTEQDERQ
jgi:hypothetical protein